MPQDPRPVGEHSRLVLLDIEYFHEAREGFDKGLDVSARVASSGSLAPVAALWTQREVRLRGILKADGRQRRDPILPGRVYAWRGPLRIDQNIFRERPAAEVTIEQRQAAAPQ